MPARGDQSGTRQGVSPPGGWGFARSKGGASARRSDSRARSTLTTRWRRPRTAPAAVGEGSVARDDLYPEIPFRRSGFLDVGDGHRMYWEESGNPAGHPVGFLHGGPGSGTSPALRRFFDPPAWRNRVFDQRGTGRSTPHAPLTAQIGRGA